VLGKVFHLSALGVWVFVVEENGCLYNITGHVGDHFHAQVYVEDILDKVGNHVATLMVGTCQIKIIMQ
jgi:hypothetical protein